MGSALVVLALLAFGVVIVGGVLTTADAIGDPTLPALELLPRVTLGAARDGELVRVHGRARPIGAALAAPLTRRACVAWRMIIDDCAPAADAPTLVNETQIAPGFFLDDGTGSALLSTAEASLFIALDHQQIRRLRKGDAVFALLAARIGERAHDFVGHKLRLREGAFELGEPLAVGGVLRVEAAAGGVGGNFREPPQQRVFRAGHDTPLYVSDNGHLTRAAEWRDHQQR